MFQRYIEPRRQVEDYLEKEILDRASQVKEQNEQDVQRQLEKLEKLQNDVLIDKERFRKMIEQAHQIQKKL